MPERERNWITAFQLMGANIPSGAVDAFQEASTEFLGMLRDLYEVFSDGIIGVSLTGLLMWEVRFALSISDLSLSPPTLESALQRILLLDHSSKHSLSG